MSEKINPQWMEYEEIAKFVLDQCAAEFGLARFEGKQTVTGSSTDWEIDARGWAADGTTFFVVECKRHVNAAISQALVGSLAYTIRDTGATGGFFVSPNGLQQGAKGVAAANRIHEIKLDPRSTKASYFGEWLGGLRLGLTATAGARASVFIEKIDASGSKTTVYDSKKS